VQDRLDRRLGAPRELVALLLLLPAGLLSPPGSHFEAGPAPALLGTMLVLAGAWLTSRPETRQVSRPLS
jgi:hypothetical protein